MEILEEKISRENKAKSETNNGWHKGGKREIKGAASGWLRHNALSILIPAFVLLILVNWI